MDTIIEIKTKNSRNKWHIYIDELMPSHFHLSIMETFEDGSVIRSWCVRPFSTHKRALNFGIKAVDLFRSHHLLYEYSEIATVYAYEKHFIFIDRDYMEVHRNWIIESSAFGMPLHSFLLYDPRGSRVDIKHLEAGLSHEVAITRVISIIDEIEASLFVSSGQLNLPLYQ